MLSLETIIILSPNVSNIGGSLYFLIDEFAILEIFYKIFQVAYIRLRPWQTFASPGLIVNSGALLMYCIP